MSASSPIASLLRVPLVAKLVGANVLIIGVCALLQAAGLWEHGGRGLLTMAVVVATSVLVTLALVLIALRPLVALELTARRVWEGDYAARVPNSPLADRSMARISTTFNLLLDRLTSDRLRMRELAAAVIKAGDRERSRAAAELHESTAQSIAAISWQLGALAREVAGTPWADRIASVQGLTEEVLEEVRFLAQTLHPRVLDDLGLSAALSQLVRKARERSSVIVSADVDPTVSAAMPEAVAAALYYVAQEAVANALYHAGAHAVTVRLKRSNATTLLEVEDDGEGFDVEAHERKAGSGIFAMRERLDLVNARLTIDSTIGHGTVVRASVANEPALMERTA